MHERRRFDFLKYEELIDLGADILTLIGFVFDTYIIHVNLSTTFI